MTTSFTKVTMNDQDETIQVPMTQAEIAQWNADALSSQKRKDAEALAFTADAKVRADGITHALSQGYTPAQAELMFP